jgi:signal transduction histidine kinase
VGRDTRLACLDCEKIPKKLAALVDPLGIRITPRVVKPAGGADAGPWVQVEVQRTRAEDCRLTVRAAVEALSALTKNALDASPNGELVVLKAVESLNGGVRFMIRDQGVGMTPEVLERVAEPFFTTKPTGQGMGLGAFLAHLFAQTLGGQLSFESEPTRSWSVPPS